MDPEEEKYGADKRIPCKYGSNCYQKNKAHHDKFKHPPKKEDISQPSKKIKIETKHNKIIEMSTRKDDNDIDNGHENVGEESQQNKETACVADQAVTENSNDLDEEKVSNDTKSIEHSDNKSHSEFIKEKFLVHMPNDFYHFYHFCESMKPTAPLQAFDSVGLTLVGPYDVLAGNFFKELPEEKYLIHWRYIRDPPELQTVLKGDDKSGYHIGYFRDDPNELPALLVSNSANKDGILMPMGGNIFAALNIYLENLKKSGDPFKKMHIGKIQSALKQEADKHNIDLSEKPQKIVEREKKIVTRTFNKIGLIVPYNKKTQLGYRELALDKKALNLLLTKLDNAGPDQENKYLSELQPVFTYANIAADECDFGTCIELGWNIIAHGTDKLNSTVAHFLGTGYRLLNREAFAKIAEVHMKNRRKGTKLSVLQ